MKTEIMDQGARGAPPALVAVGTFFSGVSINTWVAVATIAYIGIQAAYLLRKWWREERDAAAKKRGRH